MGRSADAAARVSRGEWQYAGLPDGDHRDPQRSRAKEIIMILATASALILADVSKG